LNYFSKLFFNERGIALIQVIIAAGLLGALGIFSMKLSKNMSTSTKHASVKSEITAITNELRHHLSDPDACAETFKNKAPNFSTNGDNFIKKSDGTNSTRFQANTNLRSEPLQIKKFKLADYDAISGTVNLELTFEKTIFKNVRTIPKVINLSVEVAAGVIDTCIASSTGELSIWDKNSDNSISYNGGDVFIGDSGPARNLDVSGNLSVGGTIEPIKLKSETYLSACTSAGTIAYDAANKSILYCDGTTWYMPHIPRNLVAFEGCIEVISKKTNGKVAYGKTDDTAHITNCPAGHVATGIRIRASDKLDGPTYLNCCKLKLNSIRISPTEVKSGPGNGADDQFHSVKCTNNKYVKSFSVTASNKLDGNVTIRCSELTYTNSNAAPDLCNDVGSRFENGIDDIYHYAACPVGSFMAGIRFYANNRLDRLDSITCCQKKN